VWFSHYLSWLFFIGVSVIKSFMAFELDETIYTPFILQGLHDISIAAGMIAIWFGTDRIVNWCMNRSWFIWATAFSFIIYALHVPLIYYATELAFIYWHNLPNYRLITYLVVPTCTILVCIATGAILRAIWPAGYKIATGGRGF
jgi:hypothetical protein